MGVCSCCVAAHNLQYAKPDRASPDPNLFPYYIQNQNNLWLRYTEWWPRDRANIKGVVYIVSGLGEHSGRYDSVALKLNQAGFVAFSQDNQGAGGSEGVRLYVERFSHFVDDVQDFVKAIENKYPETVNLPRFLLGHSMGGLISTHVAQRDSGFFHGVILSGPALGASMPILKVGAVRSVLRCISNCIPKLLLTSLDVNLVSRNTAVVELMKQDPFCCNDRLRARFVMELLDAQDRAFSDIARSTFPLLIVHGEDDKLCPVQHSRDFVEQAPSNDKQLLTYHDAGHEVLTEVCREEVLNDVITFICRLCSA